MQCLNIYGLHFGEYQPLMSLHQHSDLDVLYPCSILYCILTVVDLTGWGALPPSEILACRQ